MGKEKLFHVGVKALIVNDEGELLVLWIHPGDRDPLSNADLPGGRINVGETPLQALHRELEEETSIKGADNIEFFTAVVSENVRPRISDTERVGLALFVYKLNVPSSSTVVLSDEHVSYEWLSPIEAAKVLEYKFTKEFSERLLDAFGVGAK